MSGQHNAADLLIVTEIVTIERAHLCGNGTAGEPSSCGGIGSPRRLVAAALIIVNSASSVVSACRNGIVVGHLLVESHEEEIATMRSASWAASQS